MTGNHWEVRLEVSQAEYDLTGLEESIFSHNGPSSAEAYLETTYADWDGYILGYKQAADHLVEVSTQLYETDLTVYPIMFLYRHYIELQLKQLHIGLSHLLGKQKESPMNHDIALLWKEVRILLKEAWPDDQFGSQFQNIEDRIMEFHGIDRGSFSFRYPLSKKGVLSMENFSKLKEGGLSNINLVQVKRVMQGLEVLEGASEKLAEYIDIKAEMEEYYGEGSY